MASLRLPKLPNTKHAVINEQFISNTKSLPEASEEFINAIKIGFIIYPSTQLIRQVYEQQHDAIRLDDGKHQRDPKEETEKEELSMYPRLNGLHTISYLNMTSKRIIEVGDLCFCEHLRVLNLSSNYLIDIEPLRICTNMLRLDVSQNQVSINFNVLIFHLQKVFN